MRIVHVYDGHERVCPGEGSVPTAVYSLAQYAAKEGCDVTVLERRWRGFDHKQEIDGVKFRRVDLNICSNISNQEIVAKEVKKPFGFLRLIADRMLFAFKSYKYLKENDFDVIHCHLPFAANILVTMNENLGKSMVYTAHVGEEKMRFKFNSDDLPFALRFFSPDLHLMRHVRKNIVLNQNLMLRLASIGLRVEDFEVIPNGIEFSQYGKFSDEERRTIKEKYELNRRIVIMYAGTITPRKGVNDLIKAGNTIINQLGIKDVTFLLVGDFSIDERYVNRLRDYIKCRNLEKNVKFTGFVSYEDLKILYSACDIFVLPSFEEGDSIAIKEALASRKPVIGTNVGGIPAQVENGWNGFLVKPADVKQLVSRIRYLIENDEERRRMGENSRKVVEKKFSWTRIVDKYLKVYESVAR